MKVTFDAEKFSKAIKTYRIIELDIDMRAAAKKLGISAATLSRMENQGMPDLITYARVCRWLGVGMDKFIIIKK